MTDRALTTNQTTCLQLMRRKGLHMVARDAEDKWRQGQSWYLDARVNAKGIRRLFDQCNREATGTK